MQHPQNTTEFKDIINNSGDKIVITVFSSAFLELATEVEELAKEYANNDKVVFVSVRMSDCEGVE
jgi:hypothetical protein